MQCILTTRQLCYKGQGVWWNTSNSQTSANAKPGRVQTHSATTIQYWFAPGIFSFLLTCKGMSNSEVRTKNLALMAPWCNLVYLQGPLRQDTGSCYQEQTDWNSKCTLCAVLTQHWDVRINHFKHLFLTSAVPSFLQLHLVLPHHLSQYFFHASIFM